MVNNVRGTYAFTGKYNNKEVTIMASGMGMPSIGIYAYELYKFYDVENIIRIGSCGAMVPELNLFDIILSKQVYTEGNYALTFSSEDCHIEKSSEKLNQKIIETSEMQNINLIQGNTLCSEVFDEYILDLQSYKNRIPEDFSPIAVEMEAFSLFHIARKLNKNASCLMTVVDSTFKNEHISSEARENGLNQMIKLVLESI